jgi:DNA-binding CsgD family transcriptional regulator
MPFLKGIPAAVLDMLSFAVFVVDENRKPLYTNAKASALLREGGPFHLDQVGRLRIAEDADDKAFRESTSALHRRSGARNTCLVPIHVNGASPAMFAWISVLPLNAIDSHCADSGSRNCFSVMVTARSRGPVGKEVLADLFGLTLAESRLAECLIQGISPTQYAAQQGLSQNTVRNQLKSIFEKTGVRRQSDLVSLIWNVLAPAKYDA